MNWFKDNFMQANLEKFQFMFLKKYTSKEIVLKFFEIHGTEIKCEKEVKHLGITIDAKLRFDTYINILCKKAARQINVMYRFKGIFDLKERERIYNTFILSNFNCCPIIWHFCGNVTSKKIEKILERALRFMLKDQICTYEQLLEKYNYATLHIRHLQIISTEVFKSLNSLNPSFMNLRDSHLMYLPSFNKIMYG